MSPRSTILVLMAASFTVALNGTAVLAQTPYTSRLLQLFGGTRLPTSSRYEPEANPYQRRLVSTEAFFNAKRSNVEGRAYLNKQASRQRLQNEAWATQGIAERLRRHYEALEAIKQVKNDYLLRRQRMEAPPRLDDQQYDRLTGKVTWPGVFTEHHELANEVKFIDALLAQRAVSNSDSTSQASMDVRAAADRLTNELLKMHLEGMLDTMTYVRAKRFLSSLAYETNVTLYQPDAGLHMLTTYK